MLPVRTELWTSILDQEDIRKCSEDVPLQLLCLKVAQHYPVDETRSQNLSLDMSLNLNHVSAHLIRA